MFHHSVQEKVEDSQTDSGLSVCCGLIGSQSNHLSQDFSPGELIPFDVQCDVWQEGSPAYISHYLICDMSHVPYLQHLSGHVLTINYSPVRMKGMPRNTLWCQTHPGMFQAENVLFNIRSEVWTADTVYVTAVCLRRQQVLRKRIKSV